MAIIKPNNNTLSSITALPAAISTGKVLQVVQGTTGTQVEGSFSSETDLGLSVNITPTSSSNKILITSGLGGCSTRDTGTYWFLRLKKGTADTAIAAFYIGNQLSSGMETYPNLNYLDSSAGSTSQITYKLVGLRNSGTANCYFCHSGGANQPISTLTAIEIEA